MVISLKELQSAAARYRLPRIDALLFIILDVSLHKLIGCETAISNEKRNRVQLHLDKQNVVGKTDGGEDCLIMVVQ